MAYDEGLAEAMRQDLQGTEGLSEKKMFGGLCFLLNGNMLCGVHKGGAMFRVGKDAEAKALAIDGAMPLGFTGRKMGGMIEVNDQDAGEDANRQAWIAMAREFVGALPAK